MPESTDRLREDVESSAIRNAPASPFDGASLLKLTGELKNTSSNTAAEAILSGFSLFSSADAKADERKPEKNQKREADTTSAPETADQQKRIFSSTEPTESELRRVGNLSSEKIRDVKTEIAQLGRNTQDAILDAVKTNRVTGLGETHYDLNGLRDDARALLTKFADNGVTHLAVEVNKSLQLDLDNFLSGKTTEAEFKTAFMGTSRFRQNDDLLQLMKEARAAGLKVVAVDDDRDDSVVIGSKPAEGIGHRDQHMAGQISEILKSDPKSKVVFVVGSNHLEGDGGSSESPTAGQLLKAEWANKGGVATFEANLESHHGSSGRPERILVREMNTSAAIDMSKSAVLKNLEGSRAARYDNALLYPPTHTLQLQESRLGKDHPDLIPTLQRTAEHFVASSRLDEAVHLQERAVKTAEQHKGQVSAPHVHALNELAKTQSLAGNSDAAVKTLETAFSTAKQLPESERGILAVVGANLAEKYISERNFQKAEMAVSTSLQVLQRNEPAFRTSKRDVKEGLKDANPIQLAESLASVGSQRGIPKDQSRSERMLTQLADVTEAHNKDRFDAFAISARINQLADLHEAKGDFKKAEELLDKSANVAEQSGDKFGLQFALDASAAFLTRRGRHDEAAPLLERRLPLIDASFGGDPVKARVQLAENLAHRDKNDEADVLFNKALGLAKSSAEQSTAILAYAKFLEQNNQSDKAVALRKKLP